MSELEEQICQILKRRFRCSCEMKPRYCACVSDIFNLILEICEDEHEN